MAGIKSFLLKSVAFILLFVSYFSLFSFIMIQNIDQEMDSFKLVFVKVFSPMVEQSIEQQVSNQGDILEQAKTMCAVPSLQDSLSREIPGLPPDLCTKVLSGEINSQSSLVKHISTGMVQGQIDNTFENFSKFMLPQIKSAGNGFFFLFFLSAIFSALLIFVDNYALGNFIRTFCLYSMVLSIICLFSILVVWIILPSAMEMAIAQASMQNKLPQDYLPMISQVLPPLIEWFRGYILLPVAPFLVLCIFSIIGWATGFGTRKV